MSIPLKTAYAQQITAAKVLRTDEYTFPLFIISDSSVLGLRHICQYSVKNFLLFLYLFYINFLVFQANVI